ncbi:hypothetical protein ACJRO7_033023 [Eucalyptus globulus]|uniref:Uncharacterized protein n=1 Tax=Eucalyptus globulus TaxID=34317 RepID=A0ABD3JQ09_EUCGL
MALLRHVGRHLPLRPRLRHLLRAPPRSPECFGLARSISWVNAWTFSANGLVVQVEGALPTPCSPHHHAIRRLPAVGFVTAEIASMHCQPLWESSACSRIGKSMPRPRSRWWRH